MQIDNMKNVEKQENSKRARSIPALQLKHTEALYQRSNTFKILTCRITGNSPTPRACLETRDRGRGRAVTGDTC